MAYESQPNQVTPEMLDKIHARTVEKQVAELEASKRAREWPGNVDKALVMLAEAIADQQRRVAALEARFPPEHPW